MAWIIIILVLIVVLAPFIRSGQITEMERREWFEKHGYWPDW